MISWPLKSLKMARHLRLTSSELSDTFYNTRFDVAIVVYGCGLIEHTVQLVNFADKYFAIFQFSLFCGLNICSYSRGSITAHVQKIKFYAN